MEFGDSLSSYPNLEYLEGATPQDLKDKLTQIRLPFKIISIYSVGSRHFAWVSLTKKIIKIKQENKNGSSERN